MAITSTTPKLTQINKNVPAKLSCIFESFFILLRHSYQLIFFSEFPFLVMVGLPLAFTSSLYSVFTALRFTRGCVRRLFSQFSPLRQSKLGNLSPLCCYLQISVGYYRHWTLCLSHLEEEETRKKHAKTITTRLYSKAIS